MATKATERQRRYDSTHCTGFYLKLNNTTDSDIIEKLATMESKQGYIKQLIREDIARTCSVPENDTDSVPEKAYCVPESFRDPFTDTIAKAVGTWIDNATSILSDERPYIVSEKEGDK